MSTYILRGPDGVALYTGTERECAAAAAGQWPGCYVGPMRDRALVWESEDEARGDERDGERAIAEIVEVRP